MKMVSSKMLVVFTLTILIAVSSDLVSGNFPSGEPSSQLCFNPCTPTLGNNECNTICVNKKYKEGSCVGFGSPPTFNYCCCSN
ncbi:PREDICTED: putative defensin-like protein 70 [Camelina sativa]|uniref:Defensin-like protein 70 n=1 Tax=Camelina sativa TaxID=90675 RepID=A0ABM1QLL0_CAMSA|nr:PREDICTED: putative defensin-like protein 70 [Camelina sativa]